MSPVLGYAVSAGLYAAAASCALLIRADTRPPFDAARSRVAQIREGLVYLWGNKLVLGAISLDLFAVLLGGATGLLPVFARDVLEVGPQGFGILRVPGGRGARGGHVSGIPADPHPRGREDAPGRRPVRADDRGVRLSRDGFPCRCSPWRCSAARTWCRCLPGRAWCRSPPRTGCGGACRRLRRCSSGRRTSWGNSRAGSRPGCLGLSGRWRSAGSGRWP